MTNFVNTSGPLLLQDLISVKVASRETVFALIFYPLFAAGRFSKTPEQAAPAATPLRGPSMHGLDLSGPLSTAHDRRLLKAINDVLAAAIVPPVEHARTKDMRRFKESLEAIDALAPGAKQCCIEALRSPEALRFNWPDQIIIDDMQSGFNCTFKEKRTWFDPHSGWPLGHEYLFAPYR